MDIKLDNLAQTLFDDIKANKNFFETKYVIVPSPKMESYLKTYYLKKNDSVLMNVNIMSFNKAVLNLFNIKYDLADRNQIRSIIIKYLNENKDSLSDEEVKTYLKSDNYEIKLFDMASELTSLFIDLEKDNEINKLDVLKGKIYKYTIDKLKANNLITLMELLKELPTLEKKVYLFGFINHSKLEEEVLKKIPNKIEYRLDSKDTSNGQSKIEIVRAPSQIREIEYVHSKICELLLNKKEHNKLYDFLVVGTNMSDYEDTIARVFNQDDEEYPNIPYYINAPKVKNNNIYNALRTLKEIIYKGFFSRLDFDNLINNNAIKYVRGILDTDIDSWRDAINSINVYYTDEEWNYGIKRVLISKITGISDEDNIVTLDNNNYIPYASIGLDDESIVRFVKMIDDLNNIINVFDASKMFIEGINWIDSFKEALDRFLSIKDENDLETNGYYKKVSDVFEYWKTNEVINVPKKTFLETLIDVSKRSITNKGELYTSGISFTEFDKDTVLSAKYIFFINASSANLPVKKNKNSLNNNQLISYKEEQNAFNSYYNNCEKMYISFVYKDLVKDEEFFLSNFVKELKDNKISEISKKDKENIDTIHIDEDGEVIQKVFTRRGQKNKEFRKNLLASESDNTQNGKQAVDVTKQVKTNVVTTSQLGKFLDEPLSSKAERLFGSSDDSREEFEEEYSPFELNNLERSAIFKKVFARLHDCNDDEIDIAKEEIKKEFNLRKLVPNITEVINDTVFNEIFASCAELEEYIALYGKGEIRKLPDLKMVTNKGEEWNLVNSNEFVFVDNDEERIYFPIKSGKYNNKDSLTLFVVALMDLIELDKGEYTIKICPSINPEDINKVDMIKVSVDVVKAYEMLNNIYISFINYSDNYFFDYKLTDDKNFDKILPSIYDLIDKFGDNGYWAYFESKKLFDYTKDLGYDENHYYYDNLEFLADSPICIAKRKQEELVKVLFENKEGEVDEDGE